MTKIALITGATAGIGKAIAEKFAAEKINLIITGRREERLIELSVSLEQNHHIEVLPLCFDIRDREAVENAVSRLDENWAKIDVLINNAGLAAGLNLFQDGKFDDWEQMIDTNIKGLLFITRLVVPGMISRKSGHIINIGSIAGKEVYQRGNIYCSTKFAVDAITKSMRIDLLEHGIRVSQISPGLVETEFSNVRFKGDQAKAEAVYKGYKPLSGSDIADVAWFIFNAPAHVNIADVIVTPTSQANVYLNKKEA
jgi:3-hydroxy acid dehydrogenase / malonic semialdehyde reductase